MPLLSKIFSNPVDSLSVKIPSKDSSGDYAYRDGEGRSAEAFRIRGQEQRFVFLNH